MWAFWTGLYTKFGSLAFIFSIYSASTFFQGATGYLYKAKLEELEQSTKYHDHTIDTTLKAQEMLSKCKSRLVDTYTAGDIDEALYRQKLQEIDREQINLAQQIKHSEKNNPDPRATIELVYSLFKRGNTMAKRYLDVVDEEKRIMLSEALSNSTLLNRDMAQIQYKSPYDVFARTPVNASFSQVLPVRDSVTSY